MLVEMHCHTLEHSKCSFVAARDLVRQICRNGLEAVVITDHHYLWSDEELKELSDAAALPQYFLILSGQECTTSDAGDVLVYGADRAIAKGTSVSAIRVEFPEAALIYAHPYRDGHIPDEKKLKGALFDAIEIFSSNHSIAENTRGLKDWHRYRFTATAGTDSHAVSYAGLYPTLFDHPVHSVRELAGELKAARCRPYFKEAPRSKAHVQVNEVTFGEHGGREARSGVIVKQFEDEEGWRYGKRAFYIMSEIARHGFDTGKFRVPRAVEEDKENMTLIEQSLQGNALYDKIVGSDRERAKAYVRLAAQWLARLHSLRLQITPPEEFFEVEERRLNGYISHFEQVNHRFTSRIKECAEAVRRAETSLFGFHPDELFQGHGDYQPKNIFIVPGDTANPGDYHCAAIDFDSSYCLPQAFDVAVFLVQFRNQLMDHPDIIRDIPDNIFLDAYLSGVGAVNSGFFRQLELFRARGDLSIASFLVQIGLGDSENLWRVLIEAESALTRFAANG